MIRGFAARLLLLMVLLVGGVQLANWFAVRVAVRSSVAAQLQQDVEVGARVWDRLETERELQWLERVAVLADDFGFKQAIATQDAPTLQSLLESASIRLNADVAAILDPEGAVIARRLPDGVLLPPDALKGRVMLARQTGFDAGIGVVGGQPVRYALVPVLAPDLVGWMAVGHQLRVEEVTSLHDVTGLEVGVLVQAEGQARWFNDQPPEGFEGVASLVGNEADSIDGPDTSDAPWRARRLSAVGLTPVHLVLVSSPARALTPFAALQRQALWLSLLAGLVAIGFAAVAGRRVSGPLRRLAAAAESIRQGQYETRVTVGGTDEVHSLALAFNAMQAGIADREARIRYQAEHDALTGLPNRERALLRLTEDLASPPVNGLALVRVDIRQFRQINDVYGFTLGDQTLVAFARRLATAISPTGWVARLGGDDFLVALPDVTAEAAPTVAAMLIEAGTQPLSLDGTPVMLEACAGWLWVDADAAVEPATVLRRAEIAAGRAADQGLAVCAYTEGMDEAHLRSLAVLNALHGAVGSEQFHLVYQPKVRIADGTVTHCEALLRWQHPELGRVGPDEFIPLAERGGLVARLTRWVIARACEDTEHWQQKGLALGVAVNLSALDLADPALADLILGEVAAHGLPPGALIIEVTESAALADLKQAVALLSRLRERGIRVAIDDFGTGQSSLGQLRNLPADELKIDKSFVLKLAPGTNDLRIVESIVRLGHALGLSVVAEGVETAEALGLLADLHCDTAQGYYFSRPLPSEELQAWLHARSIEPGAPPG